MFLNRLVPLQDQFYLSTHTMSLQRIFTSSFIVLIALLEACTSDDTNRKLPILGERDVTPSGDTLYPQIPDFQFIDQDPLTRAGE